MAVCAVRVVKWLVLVCCLLLLWYWWQCYTLMESGRGLLAQKPTLPRISMVAPLRVSVAGGASSTVTGSPSISADFIERVLSAYGSPATGTGQALYDLGVQSGIDPVFALAFFLHEDSFGETGIGAANHSLGNIRCSAGYRCQYGFRSYATWADSYQDWYTLILNGYIKGQVTDSIVGHPCATVEEIVPVYAPSSDHNNVAAYIETIEYAVERWRSGQVWV